VPHRSPDLKPPDLPKASTKQSWPLKWLAAAATAAVVLVAVLLLIAPSAATAQLIGDLAISLAVVSAVVSCGWAARRAASERPAWLLLAVAAGLWAAGMTVFASYGILRDHVYPYPSLADVFFLSYCVPACAGLLLFPRVKDDLTNRLRTLLDTSVIALGILFASLATVLEALYLNPADDLVVNLVSFGYPAVDVVVASLVLSLGMRQPSGRRRPWIFIGGAFLVLAVTDSAYVYLLAQGQTGLTGGPLVIGWMGAWFLLALSPGVGRSTPTARSGRASTLAIEFIPYGPVILAVITSAKGLIDGDGFLVVVGVLLLTAVVARQVMIVYENVTLTGELEAQVADRTRELRGLGAIVKASPDAILSMTPQGAVTSWNPGAELLYGWSAQEMVGRDVMCLVPPSHLDDEAVVLEQVRGAAQVELESERILKDGTVVPVALTVSPIFDGEKVTGIASIQRNITDLKAKQEALRAAREKALESSRLKSEFLAMMSHEIRTPMNGVIGLTGLLMQTPLDDTQRQYAVGVQSAGESLMAVINDILDFSKLEADKVELEPDVFDPRRVVEEVAAMVTQPAQEKRLELIAYCQPEVPSRLVGDRGRIRQILLNLASNAVKFTESGEVALTMRWAVGKGEVGEALFKVSDTGIGIAQDVLPTLFDPFTQADSSTTRVYGGTGLGLAISQKLVQAMGGEIHVGSEAGVGSTFSVRVPLPVAAEGRSAPAAQHDVLADLPVLAVDDNATNRLVLESQLTAWGIVPQVLAEAESVVPTMRAAAEAGRPYAIVIVDMCMPGMNGLELARLISDDHLLGGTPLIMLTSLGHVPVEKMAEASVTEWLSKPVSTSDLYDRLVRMRSSKREPVERVRSAPGRTDVSLGRVLVVEDNALNQMVAEAVVTQLGYQVDLVANGEEALDAVTAVDYSAVLMDVHMPVMDGFTATVEIRRRQGARDRVPIIAMTAGAMVQDRDKCLAVGMDDYVSKPVKAEVLGEVLAKWISAPSNVSS